MLDETFGGFGRWPSLSQETAGWSPLVDIEEHDDAYVLEAELPGVKREDVWVPETPSPLFRVRGGCGRWLMG